MHKTEKKPEESRMSICIVICATEHNDTMRTRQKAKILEISDAPVSNSQLRCLYFACRKFLEQRGVRQCLSKVPRGEISQTGFTTFGRESKARIHFESSHMSAGLQIADVVANSVFQSLSPLSYAGQTAKELLQPLLAAQVLPGNHLTHREL